MRPLTVVVLSLLMIVVASCSRQSDADLPAEGFGILDQQLRAGAKLEVPVYLRTSETLKGIEFVLEWDVNAIQVDTPVLAEALTDFSVHARQHGPGRLKVLVFSMAGAVFDLKDPWILKIPITALPSDGGSTTLAIGSAIFAGPGATSHELPLHSCQLEILP